jgi:predicted dehydrogenase
MKILFVGLGGAGQRHLRILSELLGHKAEFLAYRKIGRPHVISRSFQIEDGMTIEEKYGVVNYTSLDDALSHRPDVAVISNPTSEHINAALPLAKAGCHIFIEKPLSHDLESLPELLRITKEKSLITYVGYQMRFHPCIREMHNILKTRKLGRILSSQIEVASFMPSWHPYENYAELYASKKELGGGVILTESHELDYAYWFFGLPSTVFATGGKYSKYVIDVEDTADITLDYANKDEQFQVNMKLCFVKQPPSRTCHILCEKGTLFWDGSDKLILFDKSTNSSTCKNFHPFERDKMFIDQLNHFLGCIAGKEKPLVDINQGLQSLRIALATKQSIETKTTVELKSINI